MRLKTDLGDIGNPARHERLSALECCDTACLFSDSAPPTLVPGRIKYTVGVRHKCIPGNGSTFQGSQARVRRASFRGTELWLRGFHAEPSVPWFSSLLFFHFKAMYFCRIMLSVVSPWSPAGLCYHAESSLLRRSDAERGSPAVIQSAHGVLSMEISMPLIQWDRIKGPRSSAPVANFRYPDLTEPSWAALARQATPAWFLLCLTGPKLSFARTCSRHD